MKRLFAALLPVLFLPFLVGCEEDQCIAPCGLLPAIVYNNQIYTNTGEELPIEVEESEIVGRITSTVSGCEWPSIEGQANFDALDTPYAMIEEGLVVLFNHEWTLFELHSNSDFILSTR